MLKKHRFEMAARERPLLPLAGFIFSFALASFGVAFLVDRGAVRWPFQGTTSVGETYVNAAVYSPVALFALFSLVWPRAAGLSVAEAFRLKRFSWIFLIALIISGGRSFYMLKSSPLALKGLAFWPPVAILSAINAFSEETIYRLSFLSLLKKALKTGLFPNVIQSALYSLTHIPVGGLKLALLALCYGLLMGTVMERDRSVIPCIICHFAIDIGYVGLPLLSL